MNPSLNLDVGDSRERRFVFSAAFVVVGLSACKLLIHLYAGRHYGYFVDELYYLACSRHLDWGYVDQPPLIALITWIVRSVLGDSLAAIRFLPAVAGAGEVVLSALIARELGGKRFAQRFAALATVAAPGILAGDSLLTMNALEPLFWMGCAWLLIRIVNTGNQRLWIWFGILAGLGIENKYSMLIFGAGVVLGLAVTSQRNLFRVPWIWAAGGVAFFIFFPNLLWNVWHHFPFFELQANIRRSGRDVPLTPLAFLGQEILTMHPLTLPLWLAGLWFYFSPAGRPFRALGWACVFSAAVVVILSRRIYYLYPAFPILFAAGAVVSEAWLGRPRRSWLKFAWSVSLAATAAILAPLAIPILPPDLYIRYAQALHVAQPQIETHTLGPLPQIFADQFGWEEMTATVARVYNSLPPEIRSKTAIFGQNYGQAGAIDMFGPKYGLPRAISGHQNYFLWGPREYTGESIIVMAGRRQDLQARCTEVQTMGTVYHPYSMPYQHFDIFYCRGLKGTLNGIWPELKNWD